MRNFFVLVVSCLCLGVVDDAQAQEHDDDSSISEKEETELFEPDPLGTEEKHKSGVGEQDADNLDHQKKEGLNTSEFPKEPMKENVSGEKGKKKKKKKEFRWSGRILVGDVLRKTEVSDNIFWKNKLSVHSVRFGFSYRHKKGHKAAMKLEAVGGRVKLKDAYIQLQGSYDLEFQVGRFKKPISSISLASKWDLPNIERGLLTELTVEEQELPLAGGRGEGMTLRYLSAHHWKPGLSLSLFQNQFGVGDVSLDAKEHFAQDFYVRAFAEPVQGLHIASTIVWVGYFGDNKVRETFALAPIVSLELNWDKPWLKVWAEGFWGWNTLAKIDGTASGKMVAARVLVAPQLHLGLPETLLPFIGASYFDPRLEESKDSISELQIGASFNFSKFWRIQMEASKTFLGGNAYSGTESTVFRIQLGASFKE